MRAVGLAAVLPNMAIIDFAVAKVLVRWELSNAMRSASRLPCQHLCKS